MIAVPHVAQVFDKIAKCLQKPDWLSRERLREIVREAVYGPSQRRQREDELEADLMAGGMSMIVAADILDGPDKPEPK